MFKSRCQNTSHTKVKWLINMPIKGIVIIFVLRVNIIKVERNADKGRNCWNVQVDVKESFCRCSMLKKYLCKNLGFTTENLSIGIFMIR